MLKTHVDILKDCLFLIKQFDQMKTMMQQMTSGKGMGNMMKQMQNMRGMN